MSSLLSVRRFASLQTIRRDAQDTVRSRKLFPNSSYSSQQRTRQTHNSRHGVDSYSLLIYINRRRKQRKEKKDRKKWKKIWTVETSDEANDRSQSAEQKRSRRSKGDSKEAELRLICSQVARRRRRVRANYLTYSPCCCYETLNKVKYKKKKKDKGEREKKNQKMEEKRRRQKIPRVWQVDERARVKARSKQPTRCQELFLSKRTCLKIIWRNSEYQPVQYLF